MWFTVTDRLSPLYGLDVQLSAGINSSVWIDGEYYVKICRLRHAPTMVGDRSLQYNSENGLGLLVLKEQLEVSSFQQDKIEYSYSTRDLYGKHIVDDKFDNPRKIDTGWYVEYSRFENALNIAAFSEPGKLVMSETAFFDADIRAVALQTLADIESAKNFDEVLSIIIEMKKDLNKDG